MRCFLFGHLWVKDVGLVVCQRCLKLDAFSTAKREGRLRNTLETVIFLALVAAMLLERFVF